MPEPCPEPGIYPNVPDATYRSWSAVSASMLKQLVNVRGEPVPPAYLKAWMDGRRDYKSKAQAFGTNYHAMVLQPDAFAARYLVVPKIKRDKRTDAYKAILEQVGGDESRIVFDEEVAEMREAHNSLRSETRQRKLICHAGACEVAVVWDDADTGLRCKALIDKLLPPGHDIAIDLKTTADIDIRPFFNDIAEYGYDVQAAHYTSGIAAAPGEWGRREVRYVIVAQEKEYPYLSRLFDLTDTRVSPCAVEVGRIKVRLAMERLVKCIERGAWVGYGPDVTPVAMVPWSIPKEGLSNE
jgi:hypothetical protein